jgi:hypothetical protein
MSETRFEAAVKGYGTYRYAGTPNLPARDRATGTGTVREKR